MIKGYLFYINNLIAIFGQKSFIGWGRKRTGRFALWCHKIFGGKLTLFEDGFIRSISLGVEGSPSFSIVEDDVGIYYDATAPSRLEHLLNTHDFEYALELMQTAKDTIAFIQKYHISKYNHAPDIDENYFPKDGKKRILIIAQTLGDMSLKYGLAEQFSTDELIQSARDENPDAHLYLKIHPDVLSGKKRSDIDIEKAKLTCNIISEDVNPISLLKCIDKVYTKTSQMGFEALLLGKECVCFGMPFYAGWGVTIDKLTCKRRTKKRTVEEIFAAAYILYARYIDPYANKEVDIIEAIEKIIEIKEKRLYKKAYFFGFSRWKHGFMEPFFVEENFSKHHFINPVLWQKHLSLALKKGLDAQSLIYIWGRKSFPEVEAYAKEHHIPIARVEDGFIRSVGLGSDLTRPYSLVIDPKGIYFDPTCESELESILDHTAFDAVTLEKAKCVRTYLLEKKLSKYNLYENVALTDLPKNKTIICVVGQVEDDASIRFGAPGMSNLLLLEQARKANPEAYILYKPHPDVLAKNRKGYITHEKIKIYADAIVEKIGLDSVLSICHEVHTMTSLVGFEALMRGLKVVTYGMPFYAGWGLTEDNQVCQRRQRQLTLDELVAGVLIAYPRYIHPKSLELCEIETFLEAFEHQKVAHKNNQTNKLYKQTRNFLVRKGQMVLRLVKR